MATYHADCKIGFDQGLKETSIAKIPQLFEDAVYIQLVPAADHPNYNYSGFKTGVQTLAKGHTRYEGRRAFPIDVLYERDQAIKVRDGVTLYADIFRTLDSNEKPVPVIIPWSPYGKTGTGPQNYDSMAPFRAGIPKERTSGYEKFEVSCHG